MKDRYLLFVSIVILCFCGLIFFFRPGPQNQAEFPGEKSTKSRSSDPVTYRIVEVPVPRKADHQTMVESDENEAENQRLLEAFFQIQESSEYQDFVDKKTQEWINTFKRTGIFNFSFQEFFDFLESQGMPRVDFVQESFEVFREYFPVGEPEDYDAEMAARFQEIFLATPGSRTEASLSTATTLYAEPDFSAWMLGRFKGELGPHLQWMDEQSAIAAGLESTSFPSSMEREATIPSPSGVERSHPTPLNESHHILPGENNESQQTNLADMPPIDDPVSLSPKRISSLRETLHQYGVDEGLLHLLETDVEGAVWFLENFNSLDELNSWIDESDTEAPSAKRQYQPNFQSLPTEEPQWKEIPE